MKKPCLVCGIPTTGARCPEHSRPPRSRPSAHARGYDRRHQAARRALKDTLPAPCGYGCGRVLHPDGDWVAAHVIDGDPDAGWIASCRSCNEKAKRRNR